MPKIKNRARLRRRMLALAPSIKAEIRPALEASAEEITDMQRNLVRKDSGATEDSIGYVWGDIKGGARRTAGVDSVNDLKITIFAGNNKSFYAPFEEFGTVKMTARPFFFPAYRALKKRAVARISRATNKALKKAGQIT